MELGRRIYAYRTKRNLSQGDLADALGVSRQSVSKWETGNATPDLDKMVKLSELFGITLDELVGSCEDAGIQTEPAQLYSLLPGGDMSPPYSQLPSLFIIHFYLTALTALTALFIFPQPGAVGRLKFEE